jgi:hypothetical protein
MIASNQVVEPVRDDAGRRQYRHRDVCAPAQQSPPAQQRPQRPTNVGDQDQPSGPSAIRGRLDKKVDVLALWQELLDRKLTESEFRELFSNQHVIAMLRTPIWIAVEAGRLAKQERQLNVRRWHEWTRELEKRHKAAGSLSLVLEGRSEKYAHRPHRKPKTGLGSTQNYSDDT